MVRIKKVLAILLALVLESEFLMTVITGVLGILIAVAVLSLIITFSAFFKVFGEISLVLLLLYGIGSIIRGIFNA